MAKAKKKKKRSSRRGSRRGLWAFMVLIVLVLLLLGAAAFVALKGEGEKAIAGQIQAVAGRKGKGAGEMESPRGIAVGPNGDVLVADMMNNRVLRFGKDGHFKSVIGRPTAIKGKAKAGELEEPSGVAVDGQGNVYVADTWNGRIQKFDPSGRQVGEYGGARYTFYSPRNVAVDRQGNVYVADTGNSQIKVIDPSGKLIKAVGSKGSGGEGFNEVFGLAINSKGELFAADPGNKRIHKFGPGPDFKFLKEKKVAGWQLNSPSWPHLTVDAQDHVIAVDNAGKKLWVYDSELNYLGTVGAPNGLEGVGSPMGIAAAADGGIWLSDAGANKLVELAPLNFPVKR
jgi:DNA-binding beta-propeller fold protein YncE